LRGRSMVGAGVREGEGIVTASRAVDRRRPVR
jgi:hypothetical protein